MAFQHLQQVLDQFGTITQQQRSSAFQHIVQHWPTLIGAALIPHTRPHRLDRHILQVATSNSVWAQHLQFERHHLAKKIAEQLNISLKEIHFSTAHWSEVSIAPTDLGSVQEHRIWQAHPSRMVSPPPAIASRSSSIVPPHVTPSQCVRAQFEAWARMCQTQYQHWPRCPHCQSPTPPGELKRWKMCSFCMSQQCHRP